MCDLLCNLSILGFSDKQYRSHVKLKMHFPKSKKWNTPDSCDISASAYLLTTILGYHWNTLYLFGLFSIITNIFRYSNQSVIFGSGCGDPRNVSALRRPEVYGGPHAHFCHPKMRPRPFLPLWRNRPGPRSRASTSSKFLLLLFYIFFTMYTLKS